MDAFDVTLHRARKLLGDPAALLLHDGRLSLNPDLVWLDIGALGHATARIERALVGGVPEQSVLAHWIRSLTKLYPSPLLRHEPDSGWLLQARDTWRRRVERHARQLAAACRALNAAPLALELYARLAEADPQHESIVGEHARLSQELRYRPEGGATPN
jgi:DNA-binding SARP family transcriptional activator